VVSSLAYLNLLGTKIVVFVVVVARVSSFANHNFILPIHYYRRLNLDKL
jgi:hypothetical protein